MWAITTDGFVSLVQDKDDARFLRARARRKEHLTDTFRWLTDADIIDFGPKASDYRWHASVPRIRVAEAMHREVMEIGYTSHVKESVSGDDEVLYGAMLSCWSALHRLQTEPSDKWDTSWREAERGFDVMHRHAEFERGEGR